MHIGIMGLTNDVLKELKKEVIRRDEIEGKNEVFESHRKKVQEKLSEKYEELEDLEAQNSNIALQFHVLVHTFPFPVGIPTAAGGSKSFHCSESNQHCEAQSSTTSPVLSRMSSLVTKQS